MKNIILTAAMVASVLVLAMTARSEENLPDSIPSGAQKRGPFPDRDSELFYYYPSGADIKKANILAIEDYRNHVLVERNFLKDGMLHGVQRKWFPNGKQKSEEPYQNGKRDGICKVWGQGGALLGQYSMSKGTGVVMVYNVAGQLVREEHFNDNFPEGLQMELYDGVVTYSWIKNRVRQGTIFGFFVSTGRIATMGFVSSEGLEVGPRIAFTDQGVFQTVSWHLGRMDGKLVTAEEYAAAQAANPLLPPYYADINDYKKFIKKEVQHLIENYRKMPPVKIPLEFANDGKPVLAK